jgi:hypothetical protein
MLEHFFGLAAVSLAIILTTPATAKPWLRHTIDSGSKGADGVRLADVNGDGLMDIATGWEEGGVVRVYRNPGPAKSKEIWPAVTVGEVSNAEDAVLVDIDGDGATDVVSSCEGKTKTLFVHWAPSEKNSYWNAAAWKTEAIPAAKENFAWMFCLPMQVDGENGVDLVVGSKGTGAAIGWLKAPEDPRRLADWKYEMICPATWIMSLKAVDFDGDGDQDVLASNRKPKIAKVQWLENLGDGKWKEHVLGCQGREVMFLDDGDLNGDGRVDVAVAVKPRVLVLLYHNRDGSWTSKDIPISDKSYGSPKAVKITDIDQDGETDLAVTCESAVGEKSGVLWLQGPTWETVHDIGGAPGIKYDRIEMIDLDGDGDLDLLTCEERDQLGVHWYENPTR